MKHIIPMRFAPHLLSLLRIMTALLFMQHGTMKLLGFPPSEMAGVKIMSLMGAAGILELGGGFLMLIGLCTPVVAFILSGQMAVAYFMMHAPQSFYPALNHGEGAILFCFIYLFFAAAGAGPWSVDAILSRKREVVM